MARPRPQPRGVHHRWWDSRKGRESTTTQSLRHRRNLRHASWHNRTSAERPLPQAGASPCLLTSFSRSLVLSFSLLPTPGPFAPQNFVPSPLVSPSFHSCSNCRWTKETGLTETPLPRSSIFSHVFHPAASSCGDDILFFLGSVPSHFLETRHRYPLLDDISHLTFNCGPRQIMSNRTQTCVWVANQWRVQASIPRPRWQT